MRNAVLFLLLTLTLLLVVALSVTIGVVDFSWQNLWDPSGVQSLIIWQMRVPRTLTAVIAGAGLSVAGLLMQTVFRNVLAGPYVLGVSAGASLGVALILLLGVGAGSAFGILSAATIGSALVMVLVVWLSRFCRNSVSLLVLGLMVGYLADALVSLLIHFGDPQRLEAFVNWGFGSFGRVHGNQILILGSAVGVGILLTLPTLKYLNTVLLGETAAQSLGVSVRRNRVLALGTTSLLTAATTVYCGPVGFIGLAVPHLARAIFRTANHRVLLPACMVIGAIIATLAGWITNLSSYGGVLPLNAVTALIGVPVVFWALLRGQGRLDD
jgi:iron complex transport system permease protein